MGFCLFGSFSSQCDFLCLLVGFQLIERHLGSLGGQFACRWTRSFSGRSARQFGALGGGNLEESDVTSRSGKVDFEAKTSQQPDVYRIDRVFAPGRDRSAWAETTTASAPCFVWNCERKSTIFRSCVAGMPSPFHPVCIWCEASQIWTVTGSVGRSFFTSSAKRFVSASISPALMSGMTRKRNPPGN